MHSDSANEPNPGEVFTCTNWQPRCHATFDNLNVDAYNAIMVKNNKTKQLKFNKCKRHQIQFFSCDSTRRNQ